MYKAIIDRLPDLSIEAREDMAETIEDMMIYNCYEARPLEQLKYWHDDEIPEEWDSELCEQLSTLDWEEAQGLVEKIRAGLPEQKGVHREWLKNWPSL